MTTHRHPWLAFFFLVLAQFMIILDGTIVTVALPSIQQAFHLSLANLQWIVTAYSLAFGGFLLLGGRTADIFGRKRVFMGGLIGFTLASLLIGLLPNGLLIAPLRGVQGLAAAYATPAALSMVLTLFSDPLQRTKVLSIWSAVSAAGGTFGLLLGGIITQFLGWRWNFFVNVPIGVLAIIGAGLLLPAHTAQERSKKLDITGGVLVTGALMLLVYAIANGGAWGWGSWQTLGSLALCIVLFSAFILNEQRVAHPLVPLSFFRIGNITAANVIMFLFSMGGFPALIMLTLYNQSLNGYDPLQSGLAMVPLGIVIGTMALLAPRLIKHFGFKRLLIVSPITVIVGMLLLMQLPEHAQFLTQELPGSLIWPLAIGPVMVSLVFAATSGVPVEESGLASGMVNTFQQIGFAVGLALLSSVASAQSTPLAGYHQAFFVVLLIALVIPILAAWFIRQPRASQPNMAPEASL